MKVTNVKVYDLKESVIACRNAMRLSPPEYTDEEFAKYNADNSKKNFMTVLSNCPLGVKLTIRQNLIICGDWPDYQINVINAIN